MHNLLRPPPHLQEQGALRVCVKSGPIQPHKLSQHQGIITARPATMKDSPSQHTHHSKTFTAAVRGAASCRHALRQYAAFFGVLSALNLQGTGKHCHNSNSSIDGCKPVLSILTTSQLASVQKHAVAD